MATERGKIKTSIGGQALIEGVMMRGPRKTVATVRKPDGSLESKEFSCEFGWRKYPVLRIPLIRGVAGFIESMAIGYKTLMYSAEAVGEDEEAEPQSRFEKWLDKTFGDKLTKIASAIGGVLGILLAIILFFWLPTRPLQSGSWRNAGGYSWPAAGVRLRKASCGLGFSCFTWLGSLV